MATSKLTASDITGQFAMVRFDCAICENTRTSDDLSVELKGELIKGGTDSIKVHVFDKSVGGKLRAKREKLRTYLQSTCLQFGSEGFLVKRSSVDDVLAKSKGIIEGFNNLLMDYVNRYDDLLFTHLNTLHPDLQAVARALSYTRDSWFKRNNIGMLPVLLMQGLSEDDNERLVDEIASASLADIKRTVNQIYKEFFVIDGKLVTSVTTTPLKKLTKLSDKVKQIALGQEGLGNIAGYIRDVLAAIPAPVGEKNNIIEGHGFSMLLNLIMLLKDEDMLRTCANDARNLPSIDVDDDWFKDEPTEVVIDVAPVTDQLPGNVVTPTIVEPVMDDIFITADEFDFD
jgi:hypothetical protein